MARIKPNTHPDTKAQGLLEGVRKTLGSTPNVFTTLAQSPAALDFFLSSSNALNAGQLSSVLREQIAVTVAGANSCDYCASAHTAIGKMKKIADNELAKNLQGKSGDAKTQAALKFTRRIVELRGFVTDEDLQAIRSAGYSEGEIVEIVTVVCHNIFTNYFNHVADTDIDFPLVNTAGVAAIVN